MTGGTCPDCRRRPPTFGVRCDECRERHRVANLRKSRSRRGDPQNMKAPTPRTCRACGRLGHDRRVCNQEKRCA